MFSSHQKVDWREKEEKSSVKQNRTKTQWSDDEGIGLMWNYKSNFLGCLVHDSSLLGPYQKFMDDYELERLYHFCEYYKGATQSCFVALKVNRSLRILWHWTSAWLIERLEEIDHDLKPELFAMSIWKIVHSEDGVFFTIFLTRLTLDQTSSMTSASYLFVMSLFIPQWTVEAIHTFERFYGDSAAFVGFKSVPNVQ